MRMARMSVTILTLATFTFLCGCASYRAAPLSSLSSEIMQSSSDINTVSVTARAFTVADCKKYLDRDVIKEGYQPIQLYIENNSDRSYHFSLDRIELSCARPEEVAEKVHTSTAGRAVGYGAAAVLTFGILAVPAIVDGVKSSQANEALDHDFSAKTATDQMIFQHSRFNKLIFVPIHDVQPQFSVTLVDQASNKPVTFRVILK